MSDETIARTGGMTTWKRALFMLVFAIIYSIAEIIVAFVAVFQLLHVLLTRHRNTRVLDLGQGLSIYIYEILRFVTFNSDVLPFPFSAWPRSRGDGNRH